MEKEQPTHVLAAYVQARDQSQMVRLSSGVTMLARATGVQTGNTLAVVEFIFPSGSGFPMHIHHREDEAFSMLEGRLLVVCGDSSSRPNPARSSMGHAPSVTATGPWAMCPPGSWSASCRQVWSNYSWRPVSR